MTSPTSDDLHLLGTAIRDRRRVAGLTLEDVAELVGALPALSAPKAAWFGTPADGYRGAVCEPAGPGAPAAAP